MNSRKLFAYVATAAITAAAYATSTFAAFTGSLSNSMDTAATTAADQTNWDIFLGYMNLIYTKIVYLVHFATQPAVLGIIATVVVLMLLAMAGYRKIMARFGGVGRRGKKRP